MTDAKRISTVLIMLLAVVLLFVFYETGANPGYVIPRRAKKAAAMILVGISVAYSSVAFQTVSFNRILTPGVMGFDYVYLFIQTLIVYFNGSSDLKTNGSTANFIISLLFMVLFVLFLYAFVLRRAKSVFLFMLAGVVLGLLFKSLSTFMQMLIDPNEFALIQDKMFASFNNIPFQLLNISAVTIALVLFAGAFMMSRMDILLLGRDNAVNLGLNYDRTINILLFMITILVAVPTALVGPVTFLGIMVSNLAYELTKTYKHSTVILMASLLASLALIGGQFIIEKIFYFNITISVVINFIGGLYFIILLLKENAGVKN